MKWQIHHGDCLAWLRSLPDDSIDAVVTDPPYGLGKPPPIRDVMRAWLDGEQYHATGGGFMGRKWDAFVPGPVVWSEVHRVLKPGGHAVVFAGQRTADVMALALRMGGFEIRDLISWCYWSGFPKSLNVSKALDSLHGAEREVVGRGQSGRNALMGGLKSTEIGAGHDITAPASDDAKQWSGFGTALKPAIEPAWLVRKPISESSIARNVLRWGTGAINIDGCRFAYGDRAWVGPDDGKPVTQHGARYRGWHREPARKYTVGGSGPPSPASPTVRPSADGPPTSTTAPRHRRRNVRPGATNCRRGRMAAVGTTTTP